MKFVKNIKLRLQASRQGKVFVRQMEQDALPPPPPPPPMIIAERLLHPGSSTHPTSNEAGRGLGEEIMTHYLLMD